MIAGPNGAGKSSIVGARIARYLHIVNPDDIARESSDGSPAAAARIAVAERRALLDRGESFGLETTLSGVVVHRYMAAAKEAGYRVMLIYLGVAAPNISRLRVITRVADGGHDVPTSDVYRRYEASLRNLPAALEIAERSWVLDNTGRWRRLQLSRDQDHVRFASPQMADWALAAIPARLRTPN